MVCAKSVIVAKARINTEDDNLSPKDAMWREVCLLAQDLPATLSSIVANENRWPRAREDLFHRGKWGAFKGQTGRDTRDGRARTGTVVLILPPTSEGQEPEGAYVKWNEVETSADDQSHSQAVELLSLESVLTARERAREVMERDAQEKLTNTQITAADIEAATPGQHLMIIESTLTTAITEQLHELFNGPWALDITRRQPPALTL